MSAFFFPFFYSGNKIYLLLLSLLQRAQVLQNVAMINKKNFNMPCSTHGPLVPLRYLQH